MSTSEAPVQDEFFDSLLSDFLDEAAQLLEQLNENLLHLDEWVNSLDEGHKSKYDDEAMNEMFRAAHSLKGLSAMLGLTEINELTHKVENVFDAARKEEMYLSAHSVELLFQSYDCLLSLIECLKTPGSEAVDCEQVKSEIANLLQAAGAERKVSSQADAEFALEPSGESQEATSESTSGTDETPPPASPDAESTGDIAAESTGDIGTESTPAEMPATSTDHDTATVDHFENVEDETDVSSKYLSIFIDEASLSLDELSEALFAVEEEQDGQTVETLLVISHRIKGSAAAVGLNRGAKLAHFMEDLLQVLRETKGTLSIEMTDTLYKCTDALRAYVEGLKNGSGPSNDFNTLVNELLAVRKGDSANEQQANPPKEEVSEETNQIVPQPTDSDQPTPNTAVTSQSLGLPERSVEEIIGKAPSSSIGFVGQVAFAENLPVAGLKAQLVLEKLSRLGEVYLSEPAAEALEQIDQLEFMTFGVVTDASAQSVKQNTNVSGVSGVELHPYEKKTTEVEPPQKVPDVAPAAAKPTASESSAKSKPAPPKAAPKPKAPSRAAPAAGGKESSKPTETLRVDIQRLDQLMNLAGQLIINKSRFTQINDGLRRLASGTNCDNLIANMFKGLARISEVADCDGERNNELESIGSYARRLQADLQIIEREISQYGKARTHVNDLGEAVHQLDRVADGIQKSVMDTRMVPIGPLFGRFRRMIRDITRGNGKDINLVIRGEKTELDKRMIDELGDPLIHMVRNSADHGIESPEDRQAAGKPTCGVVTLDAFHRGNSIVIQIEDDGKGLDSEKLLRKAIEKEIVTAADGERLTQSQIYQLIWEPGFTTAEKVTDISGRGMGMDIVRSKIEELNGTVELDSTLGRGTVFKIKLPLTLAIMPSLLAEIDGEIFAMPVESVSEIVHVLGSELATIHGRRTARVRGRVVSMVDLNEIFTWTERDTIGARQNTDEATLVIVGSEGQEIGLAVDCLLGEEDIVIKSMAENYQNVHGIAGASILGSGRVSLILDIGALVEMCSNRHELQPQS